jgi:hypothetical protein
MTTEDFLITIGKKISKAEEVKDGDIVAECHKYGVRMYCVRKVQLEWEPKTLICPAVYLKAPHVGITVKDGKPCSWYIHTPMPGEKFQYSWYQADTLAALSEEDKELIDEPYYDLYLIEHEDYVAMGQLINQVEIPYWGFMCQNRNSRASIFNFVADIQEDLKKAKEAYDSIHNKIRRWDVNQEQK